MEITDLPGNDASWYQALLEEEATASTSAEPRELEPIPQEPAPLDTVVEEPASEIGAAGVIEGTTPSSDAARVSPLVDPATDVTGTIAEGLAATPAPVVASEPDLDATTDPSLNATAIPHEPQADQATTTGDNPGPIASLADEPVDTPGTAQGDSGATAAPSLFSTGSRGADELSPMEKTSEMVGQLWTARAPDEPLAGWEPDEMDRKMSSSRPFRWTSVGAALAVVALVAVGLVLLPSIARSRAANHMEMMTAALYELRGELPDTQTSLQVATEPNSTVTALDDLSIQLTSLSAKATAVNNAGRSPLPAIPPLTSSTPIDELVPVQQRLEPLATTALTIQRRIANLVQYRTLMHDFLVLPDLPSSADPEVQADLRVALASAQAESASILAELPDDVSLSEHLVMAREINDRFATWQVDYLEALRTQDTIAAEELVSELLSGLEALDAELVTPLAQIRRQTDADLIDLASAIDSVVTLAAETGPLP